MPNTQKQFNLEVSVSINILGNNPENSYYFDTFEHVRFRTFYTGLSVFKSLSVCKYSMHILTYLLNYLYIEICL